MIVSHINRNYILKSTDEETAKNRDTDSLECEQHALFTDITVVSKIARPAPLSSSAALGDFLLLTKKDSVFFSWAHISFSM